MPMVGIYSSRNLSLHLYYTHSPSPDFRRELPPQGAKRCFRSFKPTFKFQFVGLFALLKHPLRRHPRTERKRSEGSAQAPTARPDVYLFLKSYFCITKIRFITPTVRRSFTPCIALRSRMTGAESVRRNATDNRSAGHR